MNPNPEQSAVVASDDLVKSLGGPVEKLIAEHVRADIDKEKVYQYAQARKNELYWRGIQYLSPQVVGSTIVDWVPAGTVKPNIPAEDRRNQYDYSINLIRGDGRKFIAVLGQRSPNVKSAPDRPDQETLIRRSRIADKAAGFLRAAWQVDRKHRQLAMSVWKNGTTFSYTSWVTDRQKYGIIEAPQIDWKDKPIREGEFRCAACGAATPEGMAVQSGMTCANPQCGAPLDPGGYMAPPMGPVPEQGEPKQYDNGCVELRLCSVFTVTTPFYCESLQDAPWLWYEYEEHKGALIAAYPELEGMKLDDGESGASGVQAQGKLARDLASSPTGSYVAPRKNRWAFARFWLRPSMFALLADKALRQQLVEQFPTGVKVTAVQGKVVRLEHERLDEVWAMCKPETSEYIYADPICKDYLATQDVVNDFLNIGVEAYERSIPATAVDPRIFDIKKLREHSGLPGEFIPTIPGVGARMKDSMWNLPVSEPNPNMMAFADAAKEMTREVVGVLKPIFGAESGNQTATEAEQKRTQALMQLNTTWNEMRDFWAQTYKNGAMQLAKWAAGGVTVNGAVLTDEEVADMKELLEGGWHFEAEESMPMTWSQKRALFWSIVDKGPEAWHLLGADHVLNATYIQDNLGMQGWKTPYLDARDKVLDSIRQLLQEAPIEQPPMLPPPGMAPAPPPPPVPSIPIDEFEDDHAFSVQVVKEWCQSEEGRDAKRDNPMGYKNVLAWGIAHQMLIPPPMPAGGPNGGPPPPEGAPPMPDQQDGMAAPPPQGGLAEPAQPGAGPQPEPQAA